MKVKPDVIVCWPDNCDYPLWRWYMHFNRALFNQVEIVFTKSNAGLDFSQFVRDAMFADWVMTMQSANVEAHEDWRNIAVNQALIHSLHSEWILFTEQDFFPQEGFWEEVYTLCDSNDVVAVYDAQRMHPCFILIKRETLHLTRQNFGIVPDKSDHFSMLQNDLELMGARIGKIPENLYIHMNGLSSNFHLVTIGESPNYKPEEFNKYLKDCLAAQVVLHPMFVEIASNYLKRIGQ